MIFLHDGKGSDASVLWQRDNDKTNDWTKKVGTGVLKDKNTLFKNANVRGNEIIIRVSGTSKGESFAYFGYEILNTDSDINFAKP